MIDHTARTVLESLLTGLTFTKRIVDGQIKEVSNVDDALAKLEQDMLERIKEHMIEDSDYLVDGDGLRSDIKDYFRQG